MIGSVIGSSHEQRINPNIVENGDSAGVSRANAHLILPLSLTSEQTPGAHEKGRHIGCTFDIKHTKLIYFK
jgi:hypothetical protein